MPACLVNQSARDLLMVMLCNAGNKSAAALMHAWQLGGSPDNADSFKDFRGISWLLMSAELVRLCALSTDSAWHLWPVCTAFCGHGIEMASCLLMKCTAGLQSELQDASLCTWSLARGCQQQPTSGQPCVLGLQHVDTAVCSALHWGASNPCYIMLALHSSDKVNLMHCVLLSLSDRHRKRSEGRCRSLR